MYLAHWGLEQSPFRGSGPRSFYASPTHEEALARLAFLVEQRRRLGLLLGEPGCGKSLVLEVFAEQMREAGLPAVKFSLLGLDREEFLARLAAGLRLPWNGRRTLPDAWRAIRDRLAEHRYQQFQTVVLLDDADQATSEAAGQIVRLVKQDLAPEPQLTVVLAGQASGMGTLGTSLLELIELRIDLEPWDLADAQSFVGASLAEARRSHPIFTADALLRLHELTGGMPRRVIQLADLALLAGAGSQLNEIDAATLESACYELGAIEVA